jgi:hypothetical protein
MRSKLYGKSILSSGSKPVYVLSLLSVAIILSGCPKPPTKDLRDMPTGTIEVELTRIAPDTRQSDRLKGQLDYDKGNSIDLYRMIIPGKGKLDCQVKHFSSGAKLSFELYQSLEKSPLTQLSLSGRGEKSISIDAQQGTHYAKVFVENPQDISEYEIFIQYDKNGNAAGATRISLDGKDPKGRLNYDKGDRIDWYQVKVDASEKGKLIYYVEQQSDTKLFVEFYESAPKSPGTIRSLTKESSVVRKDGVFSYPIDAQPGGIYYAKVFIKNPGDSASYGIRNTFQSEDLSPSPKAEETSLPPKTEDVSPSPEVEVAKQPEVKVDDVAPTLPDISLEITQGKATLKGIAQDNSEIKKVRIFINDQEITPTGRENKPEKTFVEFDYPITDKLQPGNNVIKVVAIDSAGKESDIQILHVEKPSIWLRSVSPVTSVQKDTAGNIFFVATESETLTIEGRVTSMNGIKQENIQITCTRGCSIYKENQVVAEDRPTRDVGDLIILAPPPKQESQQEDEQTPRKVQAFSKKILLNDELNEVRFEAVDEEGFSTVHELTVVRKLTEGLE